MSNVCRTITSCLFLIIAGKAYAAPDDVQPLLPELPPLVVNLPGGGKLTAFGTIDLDISYFNTISNGSNTGSIGSIARLESGAITVSEVGLKGEQPLNGLLGANSNFQFDLEPGFDLARLTVFNKAYFFSRSAWVGVQSGDFGTFRFGRQWNFNDDYLNASYYLPGYRLSVFRLTEFGELSDLHDNVFKYVTPSFDGLQGGVYVQARGDSGVVNKSRVEEAALHYSKGPISLSAVYDREVDIASNVISQMPSFGASYTYGIYRFRTAVAFNTLYPGLSPYPGGAGFITVPVREQANIYVLGADWSITSRLTLSGDFVYRDNVTLSNNTQVYRLFADYIVNRNIDIYSQLGFEQNHGGAAESFYSTGGSSYKSPFEKFMKDCRAFSS